MRRVVQILWADGCPAALSGLKMTRRFLRQSPKLPHATREGLPASAPIVLNRLRQPLRRLGMVQNEPLEITKTIRRHQLREMVPLADSTTTRWSSAANSHAASRCRRAASSGTSPRSTPGCWRGARSQSLAHSIPTSPSASPAQSKGRIERDRRHDCRQQRRNILPPLNPGIDGVGPFLHHVATLNLVFGLVVDAA